MKVAGRKNDGAWFRTNKRIRQLTPGERTSLGVAIQGLPNYAAYSAVVSAFAEAAGTTQLEIFGTTGSGQLADRWAASGIPRQVWLGVLSYDTYTLVGDRYVPDHAEVARKFGIEIRTLCKRFMFALRQFLDLTNVAPRDEGNPSGVADANPDA